MKRWMIAAAAAMFLLLTACGLFPDPEAAAPEQHTLYYLAAEDASYHGDQGALACEMRTLHDIDDPKQVLLQYLAGPESSETCSPFPVQLELLDVKLEDGLLTIRVSDHWAAMSPVERTLAEACMVLTMTGFPEIEQLCIQTSAETPNQQADSCLQAEDYLLYDDAVISDHVAVRLYFSDANGRYLVEEVRTRSSERPGALPDYIVNELLDGPEDENLLPVLPEGTNLLWVEIEQGVCTVNLSEAFSTNRPTDHKQARLAVFSLVNSLTELTQVESVRILCVGKALEDYAGLDLTRTLYREEMAIQDEKDSASCLDVTLYLPCGTRQLVAIPAMVRQQSGRMGADAVLNALLSFKPANGYENPFPDGAALVNQITKNGICTVTFNSAFAQRCTSETQLQTAVRAVVATLCSMEEIRQVQVEILDYSAENKEVGVPLMPENNWFLP